jgi:hypothetical protein
MDTDLFGGVIQCAATLYESGKPFGEIGSVFRRPSGLLGSHIQPAVLTCFSAMFICTAGPIFLIWASVFIEDR